MSSRVWSISARISSGERFASALVAPTCGSVARGSSPLARPPSRCRRWLGAGLAPATATGATDHASAHGPVECHCRAGGDDRRGQQAAPAAPACPLLQLLLAPALDAGHGVAGRGGALREALPHA